MAPPPSSPHSHHTLLVIQGFTRNAQWIDGGEDGGPEPFTGTQVHYTQLVNVGLKYVFIVTM